MKSKEMSILDAFLALEDIDDEDVLPVNRKLTEGKSFNVRSSDDMEEADEFVNNQSKKEVALEVIDPDADALEHLKNNEEYIGQMIIQCNSCNATKFINADKLIEAENGEGIYNVDDECPHCHSTGTGFRLIGQVGAIKEEEPEVALNNDSLTDEVKFDNDDTVEAEQKQAEPEETEEAPVEEPEQTSETPEETTSEETTPEETTQEEEVPSELADTVDETEKKDEEEDSDLTKIETEDDKNESIEESIEVVPLHVSEFLDTLIEPEHTSEFVVFDLDEDDSEEEVFKGTFDELPMGVVKSELVGFNTSEGKLIIRVSQNVSSEAKTLREVLRLFDDPFNENIIVVDAASDEELASGSVETVLEEVGDTQFEAFESPERLELRVRGMRLPEELKTPFEESLDPTNPVQNLIGNVLKANSLREHRWKKPGTNEYWLAESIKSGEDLDIIFENFVEPHGEGLIKEFKQVTGYRTELDRLLESKQVGTWTEEEAMKEAEEVLKAQSDLIAVIYGFVGEGGFKALEGNQLMEISTQQELRWATEMVERDYDVVGSVRVLYRKSIEERLDFKTRKGLTEAILDCQKNNIDYTVSRSDKEGYRYTLIKESEQIGDNLEEAKKDDELPADPEVVKTNVHAALNTLVTDKIDDINAYEEAKAEIADTHIEHKDDIINTIDRIEDETQEHIDELIDAASEIPFDKDHETTTVEEEPEEVEQAEEIDEPEEDEVEFDEEKFEGFINKWFNENGQGTKLFETLDGTIDDEGIIILEGRLKSDEGEENVSFTLVPEKDLNEDLMDSRKITTYTIVSDSLPDSLVYNESLDETEGK